MKKLLLIISFIYISAIVYCQVGINTDFPVGVFHIDGAGDNTSIEPTRQQQLNDLVVDQKGNLAVGTITPKAKLDLQKDPLSEVPILRIPNPSGLDGRVLESDKDGYPFWSEGPTSVSISVTALPGQKFYWAKKSVKWVETDKNMEVPADGNYLLTVRWCAIFNSNSYYRFSPFPASMYLYITKGSPDEYKYKYASLIVDQLQVDVLEFDFLASAQEKFRVTTSMYVGQCKKGDIVRVYVYPQQGADSDTQNGTKEMLKLADDDLPQFTLYSI